MQKFMPSLNFSLASWAALMKKPSARLREARSPGLDLDFGQGLKPCSPAKMPLMLTYPCSMLLVSLSVRALVQLLYRS